jgi:Ca2+-binding EF-hand superfamily protein
MTRYQLFLLGWVLLMIAGPAAFTQFPGGGGPGGRGGKGKMFNPDMFFNMYSGGADTFEVSKAQIPEMMTRFEPAEKTKEAMMTFLQKKGVTNGVMTRQLFNEYNQERRQEMGRRMTESNFQKLAAGRDRFDVNAVAIPQEMQRWETADQLKEKMKAFLEQKGVKDGQMTLQLYQEYSEGRRREWGEKMRNGGVNKGGDNKGGASDAEVEKQAREWFDAIDTNKDGKLTLEELNAGRQNRLRGTRVADSFDQYDKNKDKALDFEEYKAYVKDRLGGNHDQKGDQSANPAAPPVVEEKRPTVYRFGKVPKEVTDKLPWFAQLDTDQDAQIGLYEWKKAGRTVKEFLELDANGDGFLTLEELLRAERVKAQKAASTPGGTVAFATPPAEAQGAPAPGGPPGPGGMGGMPGMRGGRSGKMGGKMDWGNKGPGKGKWDGGPPNGMDFKGKRDKGGKRGQRGQGQGPE